MERSAGSGCTRMLGTLLAGVAVVLALGAAPHDARAAFSLADFADAPATGETWDVLGVLGERLKGEDDALSQAIEAGQTVTYEAAGVSIELPEPVEVVALPGVFATGAYGDDFFVSLTQQAGDAVQGEGMTPEELMAGWEAEGLATFAFTVPGGGEGFGYTLEGSSLVCLDVYVLTPSGDLANLWIKYPVDQGPGYIAASALAFNSLQLVEKPAAVQGSVEMAEVVNADGLTFSTPGLAWDDELEGWLGTGDSLLFVHTMDDFLSGVVGLTPDDLGACVGDLLGYGGVELGSAVLVNPWGDHVYVHAGLGDSGYLEVYAFVPLPDGTVTLVAALCDAESPEATSHLAALLHSIAVVPGAADEGPLTGMFGGARERAGASKSSPSRADLLNDPAFVASAKMA